LRFRLLHLEYNEVEPFLSANTAFLDRLVIEGTSVLKEAEIEKFLVSNKRLNEFPGDFPNV